jgi:hypothetical protein
MYTPHQLSPAEKERRSVLLLLEVERQGRLVKGGMGSSSLLASD